VIEECLTATLSWAYAGYGGSETFSEGMGHGDGEGVDAYGAVWGAGDGADTYGVPRDQGAGEGKG
jgi:hypothetical protein